jgi:hypothetical protein
VLNAPILRLQIEMSRFLKPFDESKVSAPRMAIIIRQGDFVVGENRVLGSLQGNLLPARFHADEKVSRVSLVLAHDSAAARTNTGAETRI